MEEARLEGLYAVDSISVLEKANYRDRHQTRGRQGEGRGDRLQRGTHIQKLGQTWMSFFFFFLSIMDIDKLIGFGKVVCI